MEQPAGEKLYSGADDGGEKKAAQGLFSVRVEQKEDEHGSRAVYGEPGPVKKAAVTPLSLCHPAKENLPEVAGYGCHKKEKDTVFWPKCRNAMSHTYQYVSGGGEIFRRNLSS